jgi:tRNA pseudouridine65 synthase
MFMEILYHDESITILNKPSGLITHRGALSDDKDSVVDRLRQIYAAAPAPVHRLDRPASGVLIAANDADAARILCEAFQSGQVHKTYHAVVRGWVTEPGEINIPLKKYKEGKAVKGEGEEQEALSRYAPLKRAEIPLENNRFPTSRYSLIEAEPVTGRFHQLRRHLARTGHPIVGDTAHGDLRHNAIMTRYLGNDRLLLHARRICFPHPLSGEIMTIDAPYPQDFERICSILFDL